MIKDNCPGLIPEPHVGIVELTQSDEFLVIGSDGLFEVCPSFSRTSFGYIFLSLSSLYQAMFRVSIFVLRSNLVAIRYSGGTS